MTRISVSPDMLRWARDRARLDVFALEARFPKLADWETGEAQPTLKQLEDYARATHAPIGYFFLPEPPVEQIPIPDFRTMANRAVTRPSPNLLDTIYACQERQAWYRDFVLVNGESPLPFVGALNTGLRPCRLLNRFVEDWGSTWMPDVIVVHGRRLCDCSSSKPSALVRW